MSNIQKSDMKGIFLVCKSSNILTADNTPTETVYTSPCSPLDGVSLFFMWLLFVLFDFERELLLPQVIL